MTQHGATVRLCSMSIVVFVLILFIIFFDFFLFVLLSCCGHLLGITDQQALFDVGAVEFASFTRTGTGTGTSAHRCSREPGLQLLFDQLFSSHELDLHLLDGKLLSRLGAMRGLRWLQLVALRHIDDSLLHGGIVLDSLSALFVLLVLLVPLALTRQCDLTVIAIAHVQTAVIVILIIVIVVIIVDGGDI